MKRKISSAIGIVLVICCLVTLPQQTVLAMSDDSTAVQEAVPRQNEFLDQFGEIDASQKITINGVENPLFCEFIDPATALNNLKVIEANSLAELAQSYGLSELSASNWKEYQAASNNSGNRAISDFFDIYENTEKNDEAVALANALSSAYAINSNLEDANLEQLSFMLPYFAPLAEEYNSTTNAGSGISVCATIPNVSAAVSYAERYAWNANTAQYHDFGGTDCTNFVSQILEAGGVAQESSSSEYYGWWHRIENGQHKHSISWIRSDTFVRYMGVGYTTNRIMNLSMNIQVGDILALDNSSDGDWDHMGFVTYKSNSFGSYYLDNMLLSYYDFIIAQHSSNYNCWVSEDTNSWDRYDWTFGGYGTYARVRR